MVVELLQFRTLLPLTLCVCIRSPYVFVYDKKLCIFLPILVHE